MTSGSPRVWVLTPDRYAASEVETLARDVAASGVDGAALLVRVSDTIEEASRAAARGLRGSSVALYVKGDVALAREVSAHGVHLGSRLHALPRALADFAGRVAVALHADEECLSCARSAGVDLARIDALVSPIFLTPGKGAPRGVAALSFAARTLPSVVALGGVDAENARACFDAGARGVAVIRAVIATEDRGRALRALRDLAGAA